MFFKDFLFLLFVKFLWVGLALGVVSIVLKFIAKLFRKNVYVVNFLTFCFWICFGGIYCFMCLRFNNYSFSGIGLSAMLLGIIIIKISIDFFFDYFVRFIYNEVSSLKRKRRNGKLQANKEV